MLSYFPEGTAGQAERDERRGSRGFIVERHFIDDQIQYVEWKGQDRAAPGKVCRVSVTGIIFKEPGRPTGKLTVVLDR